MRGGWWRAPGPLLALCALAGCFQESRKTLEGIEGENVVLSPVVHGTKTEIVWKQAEDKVAEWNGNYTQYYRTWKGRAELDSVSGNLTIRNVSETDAGTFKAEVIIGTKYQNTFVTLKIFKSPAPPTLSCSASVDVILLNCTPANQPLPNLTLSYSWTFPDKSEHPERRPSIQLPKSPNLPETVTCAIRVSSSVASTSLRLADCDPRVAAASTRIHTAAVLSFALLLSLAVVGIFLWKRGTLDRWRNRIMKRQQGPGQQRAAASGDAEEGEPLNDPKPEGVAERLEERDLSNGPSAKSGMGKNLAGNAEGTPEDFGTSPEPDREAVRLPPSDTRDMPPWDSGVSLEHEREPVNGRKPEEESEGCIGGGEGTPCGSRESSPRPEKEVPAPEISQCQNKEAKSDVGGL